MMRYKKVCSKRGILVKKVLGLDIGIRSVGWGIIDHETGEIIDDGVCLSLFDKPVGTPEPRDSPPNP